MLKRILHSILLTTVFLVVIPQFLFSQIKFDPYLKTRGILKPIEYKETPRFNQNENSLKKGKAESLRDLETQLGDVTIIGGNGLNEVLSIEFTGGNYFVLGRYNQNVGIEDQSLNNDSGEAYFLAKLDNNFELLELNEIASGAIGYIDITLFQDDILIYSIVDSLSVINGREYSLTNKGIVINLISTDLQYKWDQTFTNIYQNSNDPLYKIALDVTDSLIYFTTDYYSILSVDSLGSVTDSIEFDPFSNSGNASQSRITDLKIKGGELISVGNLTHPLEIGGVIVDPPNSTSFFASIDINSSTANWVYTSSQNSGFNFSSIDKIYLDESGNFFLTGRFEGEMSWQNQVITSIDERGLFTSKFLPNGAHDTTLVINASRTDFSAYSLERYISELTDNELIILNNSSFYSYYFENDTINENNTINFNLNNFEYTEKTNLDDEEINIINNIVSKNGQYFILGSQNYEAQILASSNLSENLLPPVNFKSELPGRFTIVDELTYNSSQFFLGYIDGIVKIADSIVYTPDRLHLCKSTNGKLDWVKSFPNAEVLFSMDNPLKIVNNELFLSGYIPTLEPTYFEEIEKEISGSFISKLDLSGRIKWIHDFKKEFQFSYEEIDNDIYIVGSFFDSLKVNDEYIYTLNNESNASLIAMRFNNNGDNKWFNRITGENANFTYGYIDMAVDSEGIYGSINMVNFNENVNIRLENDSTFQSSGSLIVKFNTEGQLDYVKNVFGPFSSIFDTNVSEISTFDDDIIVTGFVGTDVSFFNDSLLAEGFQNIFLARVSDSDEILWKRIFTHNGSSTVSFPKLATDGAGNVYSANYGIGSYSLNDGPTISEDTYFMSKFSSDGALDYINTFQFSNSTSIRDFSVYSEDNVVIAGFFNGQYTIGSVSDYARRGASVIINFCQPPSSTPSVISGDTMVLQNDTSYYSNSMNYFKVNWQLTPEAAGTLLYSDSDSLAIEWSSTFEGKAELKYREINNCGEGMLSDVLVINVETEAALSINKALDNKVYLYPNPVTAIISIDSKLNLASSILEISDINGSKIMLIDDFSLNDGINVSALAAGLYFITLKFDEGNVTKKFVKK